MKKLYIKKHLKNIKLILTDCDGVLTDAGMYYGEQGEMLKKFNTRDGMAFSLLKKQNYLIGIITGEDTQIVQKRADKLKMDFYILNAKNKLESLSNICQKNSIGFDEVLYFGDDINDLEAMKKVGIAVCPKDACKQIKKISHYITKCPGGTGVIREFYERFMVK